jgi:hypothetical protein
MKSFVCVQDELRFLIYGEVINLDFTNILLGYSGLFVSLNTLKIFSSSFRQSCFDFLVESIVQEQIENIDIGIVRLFK